jgi:hypothetical protein
MCARRLSRSFDVDQMPDDSRPMHPYLAYMLAQERSADLQRAALLRSARPERPARPGAGSSNQGGPQCR